MFIEIQTTISRYCRKHKEISAVYLFGSRARNTYQPDSDVDLAVLLKNRHGDFDLLDFIVSIEKLLKLPVDAVVLNRAGEILKYQVRLHGILLYEEDATHRKAFEVKSRKEYEDFLHLHKRYVKNVLYGELDG
jgi:predicted nucleotidyltransferase